MNLTQFERDLNFFKKNFNIYPVDDLFKRYRECIPIDNNEIALTFDDGFLNNYKYVKPLLEKYEIPATFYILSKSIEDENFINWSDLVEIICRHSNNKFIIFGENKYYQEDNWKNNHGIGLFDTIKSMGEERNTLLSELFAKYNGHTILKKITPDLWKLMNKEQIIRCSESKYITIGSHTRNHFNLSNISSELARTELSSSKSLIEDSIQKEVIELAYPDGSYNQEVKDIAEKTGYSIQLAVNYKEENDTEDYRILNRFSISNSTTHESNIIRMYLNK